MQVEAIYDHGKLEFMVPIQLRHERIKVVVQVPDEEIESSRNSGNLPLEIVEHARAMREKLDAIRNAPSPPDSELPELTEKQLARIDAFELRADR